MRKSTSLILPAAVATAFGGPAIAADVPGFNEMDKDNNGELTRSEAQGNPKLADQFNMVDDDKNGTLSRGEYLGIMARQDLYNLRESLAEYLNPEGQAPLAANGKRGSEASAGASAAQHVPDAASERLVRNLQQTLQDKGIDPGPIDGIWGPRTSAALRDFQQNQGLDATGQLNAQTLAALGIPEEG
jgi:hypothetical protein